MKRLGGAVHRSRRWFLRAGATIGTTLGGTLSSALTPSAAAGQTAAQDVLGDPVSTYGARSRFVSALRAVGGTRTPQSTVSYTPLAASYGALTPASLHFERHHAGVPHLDPTRHQLTIHGLVDRPLTFSLDELKRFPAVSRLCFIECAGNSSSEWRGASAPDVQRSHGLTSCSEWTGVTFATLAAACAPQSTAAWVLAEGADAARVARSPPLAKMMTDALVVYAQNGEDLRPEQGFPLRLIVPGYEGITHIKWLHRLRVLDAPAMTRWETARYTDTLADGRSRLFTFEMDAKSIITTPSGGHRLTGPGPYEITGLAWSGRGAIARVDVTLDGGASWVEAELQTRPAPTAHTRFRLAWTWDGREALIASRVTDDTGYRQPTLGELVAARGVNSGYHQNAIHPWRVAADGRVSNGL